MLAQIYSKFLGFFASQLFLLANIILLLFALNSCSSDSNSPQLIGTTMGTSYSIQWKELPASADPKQLKASVESRLQDINDLMSTYRPHSQLSGFNQSRETGWHAVEMELAHLIGLALKISRQSGGAFDVTVGPLVNLWGFGPNEIEFTIPTQTEISIAKRSVGFQHLETRLEPAALNKKIVDLQVDLSAIAKGYAVDEVAKIMDANAVEHYMVEIGGEVKSKGIAPHGEPWRIGIEAPHTQGGTIAAVLSLKNTGAATSGDYRDSFVHEGITYSHTINPATGYPVTHNLVSVTVIHQSVAVADAWATAFMVLGPKLTFETAQQKKLAVFLITREENKFKSTASDAMKAYLVD